MAKDTWIQVRVTSKEKRDAEAVAQAAEASMSELIRAALFLFKDNPGILETLVRAVRSEKK